MRIKNYFIVSALALSAMNATGQASQEANSSPKKMTFILPNGKELKSNKLDSLESAWGKGRVQFQHSEEDDTKGIMHLVRKTDEYVNQQAKTENALSSMLNKPAPQFELKDLQGKNWSLKELRGKIVVLNFWFTSCAPCVAEIPELNKLVQDYYGKDVVFIALTYSTKEQVTAFLKKRPFNYKQLTNSKEVDKMYNIPLWPTSIVIDQSGTIRSIIGSSKKNYEDLEAVITPLLKDRS
jgi:peroxiredoxin